MPAATLEGGSWELPSALASDAPPVTRQQLMALAEKAIQRILDRRFSHPYKREIVPRVGRLNFACPYCGDSAKVMHKKRGNLYLDTFTFRCYNSGCNRTRHFVDFVRDFGEAAAIDHTAMVPLLEMKAQRRSAMTSYVRAQRADALLGDALEQAMVPRADLLARLGLVEVAGTEMETYLIKRTQRDFTRFAWDPKKRGLHVLNLDAAGERVLGMQVRTFREGTGGKYLTFKLTKVREMAGLPELDPELADAADGVSYAFRLLEADLSRPVTVFEGPMDSFLFPNAVALCSVSNSMPIDVGSVRYLYDCDRAGRAETMKKVAQGESVFMWKKYLADAGVCWLKPKLDYNDLITYAQRKGISLPDPEGYFTSSKYDIPWI